MPKNKMPDIPKRPVGRPRKDAGVDYEALAELASQALARKSFVDFNVRVDPMYQSARHTRLLCEHLEALKNNEIERLMIAMPPRHGKPCSIESMVLLGDGSYKRLGDIEIGDSVITHLGRPRIVQEIFEQPAQVGVKITAQSGRVTEAAIDHPFLTPEGWVLAGDLVLGQCLGNVAGSKTEFLNIGAFEEYRLAGYFIGDGSCTQNGHTLGAGVTAVDPAVVLDIEACAAALGFQTHRAAKKITTNLSGGIRPWLRDRGLAGKGAYDKRVPSWVFTSSPEAISHFLGAYFDCDGTVAIRGQARAGGVRKDVCCELYSVSRELLIDCQRLFLRLGIQTRLRKKMGSYKGEPHTSWRLAITDMDGVARFTEIVTLRSAKSAKRARYMRTKFAQPILPDPITGIESIASLDCRCLTVAEDHTFTSDDFIVHNTLHASERFPAWWLGERPRDQIIIASYTSDRATASSRKARELFRDPKWPFPQAKIDPTSTAVDEWRTTAGGIFKATGVGGSMTGFGAHCLVGNTQVETPLGSVRIDSIRAGDFVLSYDRGRTVYRKVVATQFKKVRTFFRISTSAGGVVEATGNHPFLTQRGWVEADNLAAGDVLVRAMRRDDHEARMRCREMHSASQGRQAVLWQAMRQSVSVSGSSAARVQHLRSQDGIANDTQAWSAAAMQRCVSQGREQGQGSDRKIDPGSTMSVLQQTYSPQTGESMLQPGVRGSHACVSHDGQSKSGLARRHDAATAAAAFGASVSQDAPANLGARQPRVRSVREYGRSSRSPHQHEPVGQPMVESCDSLRNVPHRAACEGSFEAASDTVALVERVCESAVVYDLQVQATECFFANNLLAHNCLIIDDPVKDRAEANSPVRRQTIWDWYVEVASTRMMPGGKQLVMSTRWHEDDLSGRILSSPDYKRWTVLELPAIAICPECDSIKGYTEEGYCGHDIHDRIGRLPGEELWPESGLEIPRPGMSSMTTRAFASLYQQRPTPDDGTMFKRAWFANRYQFLPKLKRVVLFIDGAWKTGVGNDRSAFAIWGTDGQNYFLIDAWAGRVEYSELKVKFLDYYNRWMKKQLAPVFTVCIEDAASGIPLISEFKKTTAVPVIGVPVDKAKEVRAEAVTDLFESGRTFFPVLAEWLDEFIEEHVKFPGGTHDDFVDTSSGALARLRVAANAGLAFAKIVNDVAESFSLPKPWQALGPAKNVTPIDAPVMVVEPKPLSPGFSFGRRKAS